ncbi:MAG: hypothetical protein K9J06_15395 [Flavobacteriales bacterium]|nr:hypothetical protein [Flavobacteriales bacterium]
MPRRIPQALAEFETYLNNTVKWLFEGTPPNGERLGLSEEQMMHWRSYAQHWKMLYHQSVDDSKSTPVIRKDRDIAWKKFVKFAQPVVNLIAASPALTVRDRSTFHIDPPPKRGRRRGRMRDVPMVGMRNGDGASLRIVCKLMDGGRPRMHPLADLIEMRYVLQTPTGIKDGALQWPALPKSPNECPLVVLSSHAKFLVEVGMKNSGKLLCAYFRYINASDRDKNGPWSTLQVIVVS